MAQVGNNPEIPQQTVVNSGNIVVTSGSVTTTSASSTKNLNDSFSIAKGETAGYNIFNFYCEDEAVGTSRKVLWGLSGDPHVLVPGFAERLKIVSSNAADTAAGSGARSVFVIGADSAGNALTELVPLNGTTSVTTSNFFLRITRLLVASAGASAANVGNITVKNNAETQNMYYMVAGENVDHTGFKSTNKNENGYIETLVVATDSDATVEVILWVGAWGSFFIPQIKVLASGAATTVVPIHKNFSVAQQGDFKVTGQKLSTGGGSSATIKVQINGVLNQ